MQSTVVLPQLHLSALNVHVPGQCHHSIVQRYDSAMLPVLL